MKIFCSGIGGIGLSAYAAYRRASGHEVMGSEKAESPLVEDLRGQGIEVSLLQDGAAVPADTDLFVYTLALPEDHPERRRAAELGIPQKTYFEALGDLTRGTGLIAVCGTHGKSSTTAMAAKVLIEAGLDPSVIVGTKTADLQGRNWRKDTHPQRDASLRWLVEACEYHRSFLHLSPHIILLTNADGDHFDYFKDSEDYRKAFEEFIAKLPQEGILITHLRDPVLQSIAEGAQSRGVRVLDADDFPLLKLKVPGRHMRENAQLALALAEVLGIPRAGAEVSLAAYAGAWRRMEVKGETPEGVLVLDDYGHHPAEVRATLQALSEAYPDRRLVCVFQPHTHDRTLKLYSDLIGSFKTAHVVVIPNIYDARPKGEEHRVDVSKLVADIARTSGVDVQDGRSLEDTVKLLQGNILQSGDLLLTMGAGDVGRIAEQILHLP